MNMSEGPDQAGILRKDIQAKEIADAKAPRLEHRGGASGWGVFLEEDRQV